MKRWASWLVPVILLASLILASCTQEPPAETSQVEKNMLPLLSPDGKHLLSLSGGKFSVSTFPEQEVILNIPVKKGEVVEDLLWSHQSDAFAYHARKGQRSEYGIYIVGLDGSLDKVAELELTGPGSRQILWSPCGRYLFWDIPFFSVYDRETQSVLIKSEISGHVRSPLFSKDGSKLAFTLLGDDGAENLWVMDVSTGNARQVTQEGEGDYPFFWANDTKLFARIGAVSTGGGYVYGLAAIDLGTGSREIIDAEMNDSPQDGGTAPRVSRLNVAKSISPDGNYLIGECRTLAGTESRIYLLELATGRREVILEGKTPAEGYGLVQCLWLEDGQAVLNVKRESYESSNVAWQETHEVLLYSPGNDSVLLAESPSRIDLLGVADGRLYYVTAEDDLLRYVLLENTE